VPLPNRTCNPLVASSDNKSPSPSASSVGPEEVTAFRGELGVTRGTNGGAVLVVSLAFEVAGVMGQSTAILGAVEGVSGMASFSLRGFFLA